MQNELEHLEIKNFTENAYLNYAMYVILDRALPHIGDGLKPVQRRIIYAMSELNLQATAKHKKSARTVGDVLGKFHPHGDSACYEAMVLMAQDFSYRYTLVDGQGNWGSPDDPKSFAAMRYTESRLAKYAQILLQELNEATAQWVPNFDGTVQEPKVLPARLPNVLLNGTTGIAVGMATDIPPHNITEVANACIALLDDPTLDLAALCEYIQGPDFPTNAEIITPKHEIVAMYNTGYGSLRMRAVYITEQAAVIITALPYMVSGSKVLEQMAAQMQNKKLPMVVDLRDESDHENPTRLVILLKSNKVDIGELMSHLFATTELERSYRVNLNMIGLDGKPQVKGLLPLLKEWLLFRQDVVRRRLQYRLDKVLARLHVLEGYLIAYLNIDEVIKIIRESNEPKQALMRRYKLSELQAEAILDLKLRHLAKLEEAKIQGEQNELATEQAMLEKTLGSDKLLKNLIKQELKADLKTFGDKRRSPLINREVAKVIDYTKRSVAEPITVVLSTKGWVRAAKSHEVDFANLSYKAGDSYQAHICAKSDQDLVFFDSSGRAYNLAASNLPSIRGQGEPLTSKLSPPDGVSFIALTVVDPSAKYIVISNAGYGFIVSGSELITKNRKGKAIVNLGANAKVIAFEPLPNNYQAAKFAMVTNDARLLIIATTEIPELPKGKGKKLFAISAAELAQGSVVVSVTKVFMPKSGLTIVSAKKPQQLIGAQLTEYFGEPGQRGKKLPKNFLKGGSLQMPFNLS